VNDLVEGQLASYVGDGHTGISLGAQGEVLAFAGHGAHVTLVPRDDLAALSSGNRARQQYVASQVVMGGLADELDDSLDVGAPPLSTVASVQQSEGTVGVLNMLAAQGYLQRSLSTLNEEVMSVVAHRIRQDPGVREVTAQLDDDDAEDLVQLASLNFLQNSFGVLHG
jgi:hypothetical protein